MSGIVGYWNLEGPNAESILLDRLGATLAHRGGDGYGTWIHETVGLGCQLFRVTPESAREKQPVADHTGASIVFDGRLDNREELIPALKDFGDITPESPDPVVVLGAFQRFGDSFVERLAGDFALGLFDLGRRRLLVARDALGVRPLYYSKAGQTFLFASEIKAILAHPGVAARPDDDAVADFLLGTRDLFRRGWTFFQDVRAVCPGEMLVVTRERMESHKYWDFDVGKRLRLGSMQEYAEAFRGHFETAVRRRLRSSYPVAVAVSGGLDSSSIFCVAKRQSRKVPQLCPSIVGVAAVYEDNTPADEKAFLLEMEREYACTIERMPMGVSAFLEGGCQAIRSVEAPFLNLQWRAYDQLLAAIQQQGARVLLTGDWGDQILFEQAYLVDLFRRLSWRRMLSHLKEFPRWFTDAEPGIFRRNFVRNLVRHNLPEAVLRSLRRVRNRVTPPSGPAWYTGRFRARARKWAVSAGPVSSAGTVHATSLYSEARAGYHYLMLERHNKISAGRGLEPAFPFLDRDLVSFLMAIPGDMQTCDGVPKALLRQSLRGLVPDGILGRRSKADPSGLVNQGMEQELAKVVQYLDFHHRADTMGYLNAQVVREGLEGLRKDLRTSNNCLTSWSIRDILGLEFWLEVFFTEEAALHSSER